RVSRSPVAQQAQPDPYPVHGARHAGGDRQPHHQPGAQRGGDRPAQPAEQDGGDDPPRIGQLLPHTHPPSLPCRSPRRPPGHPDFSLKPPLTPGRGADQKLLITLVSTFVIVDGWRASYAAAREEEAIFCSVSRSAWSPYAMVNTRIEFSRWVASRSCSSRGRSLSRGYSFWPSVSTTTALIRV